MATRSSLLGGPDTSPPPPLLSSPLETKTIAAATPTTTSISFSPPIQLQYPKLSCCLFHSNSLHFPSRKGLTVLAVVDKETEKAEKINNVNQENGDFESKKQTKSCELYVCNLSGCSDIAYLAEMFNSFGSVLSVEVSRKPGTGVSRGCGYITMTSIESARNAVSTLDGSVELFLCLIYVLPEIRLLFSRMSVAGKCGPHKLYIGNLPWNSKLEDLRNLSSQFGAVDSARVLYDRKGGKNRTYAFLSFSSAAERDAALSMNGTSGNYN
uniref:RRM domain-containing protein n=1 Tax=Salix viminalis TaxID=40686 RepID=A0A6N2L9S1_SALVM